MRKRIKVFLPKWMRWFLVALFVVIWASVTYDVFGYGTPESGDVTGWIVATVVLLAVGVLIFLVSGGRLPAYEIEIEEEDERR